MAVRIISFSLIVIGLWGIFSTIKFDNNSLPRLFLEKDHRYEVIDKKKYNNVFKISSYLLGLFFICIGSIAIIIDSKNVLMIVGISGIMPLITRVFAKKYIKHV